MMTHVPQTVSELISLHADRIALIRQYANEANGEDFETKWMDVLQRCATWFSSMPLRPAEHAEPGGAFRATVEAAYFAMRLSAAQKFGADQPSERRRRLEPQYLYALFLAACSSRLDEPCRHFRFHRESDGAEWIPAAHGGFGSWLADSPYRVSRRETAMPLERMRTALLAREILGQVRLAMFEGQVLADLFGAINPDPRPSGLESLLHKVVRQAIETVTSFEIKARKAEFAPVNAAAPSAHLLDDIADKTIAPASASLDAMQAPATEGSTGVATGSNASTKSAAGPSDTEAKPISSAETINVLRLDGTRSLRKDSSEDDPFKALAGSSNLMREFFKALAQDIADGKAKAVRIDGKVAISKRMLGNYGLASDTLIEHLRKGKHLYRVEGQNILLVDEVGNLVAPAQAS